MLDSSPDEPPASLFAGIDGRAGERRLVPMEALLGALIGKVSPAGSREVRAVGMRSESVRPADAG